MALNLALSLFGSDSSSDSGSRSRLWLWIGSNATCLALALSFAQSLVWASAVLARFCYAFGSESCFGYGFAYGFGTDEAIMNPLNGLYNKDTDSILMEATIKILSS